MFSSVWEILTHPVYNVLIAFIFAIVARRIHFRRNDLEPKD